MGYCNFGEMFLKSLNKNFRKSLINRTVSLKTQSLKNIFEDALKWDKENDQFKKKHNTL